MDFFRGWIPDLFLGFLWFPSYPPNKKKTFRKEAKKIYENAPPVLTELQHSLFTPPETNSSPLKIGHPKRKLVFQPSIFRCYVSFREGNDSIPKNPDLSRKIVGLMVETSHPQNRSQGVIPSLMDVPGFLGYSLYFQLKTYVKHLEVYRYRYPVFSLVTSILEAVTSLEAISDVQLWHPDMDRVRSAPDGVLQFLSLVLALGRWFIGIIIQLKKS